MAYVKKADREAGTVDMKITADGVFIAEDVRKDKGDTASVDADIAATLIENGHARKA